MCAELEIEFSARGLMGTQVIRAAQPCGVFPELDLGEERDRSVGMTRAAPSPAADDLSSTSFAIPSRFPVPPRPSSPMFGEYCASRIFGKGEPEPPMGRSRSTNSVLHADRALGGGEVSEESGCIPRVRTQVGKLSDRLPLSEHPSALGCLKRASSYTELSTAQGCSTGRRPPLPMAEGTAELDARIHLSRQTVQFVQGKLASYTRLSRGRIGIWSLLAAIDARAAPGTLRLALCVARACSAAFPEARWAPLLGPLAVLGRALLLLEFGGECRWAVLGEGFPVGCRIHPAVAASAVRFANADRHRRDYSSTTGMYAPGCGLSGVHMSWTGAEYLYLVLMLNQTALPREAMFLLRYQNFWALFRAGKPYHALLDADDEALLPRLRRFQEILAKCESEVREKARAGKAEEEEDAKIEGVCEDLIREFIDPSGTLSW